MAVNKHNYFSQNNTLKYFGSSQYKSFQKCSACATAEAYGLWKREETTSLLVGSYIDAWFEGTLDAFKQQHFNEIFTNKGALRSDFESAEKIIERVQKDEVFMHYMSGRKQVVKTGTIEGVPFKIKMDSYHKGKMIVDLKIIKDFKPLYDEQEGYYRDFIRYWGYDKQGAIYQAVEGNNLPFFLCVATKEKTPDIKVIQIPQTWLDDAMVEIKHSIEMYDMIKHKEIEAIRCEHCDYCKSTKVLTGPVSAEEFALYD